MKRITKADRDIFEKYLHRVITDLYGIDGRKLTSTKGVTDSYHVAKSVETVYGELWLRWFDARDSVYTLCAQFVDVQQLPPEGYIHGFSFNKLNGKWNMHLGSDWSALDAAKHMQAALTSVVDWGKQPVTG